ncbi:hypothetical protein [Chitinilyticum piscinae]|uniref:Uncharacterized protein n=1 Tax=Chitinilyticum piscinae TaxID=2866724 RepID=A0A8J7K880_9NEIS|nr:hypothetical protein [Chitinilyticum piscinae]MBE9609118.1 hypothetical protein [Chitinilyticum piscinae]
MADDSINPLFNKMNALMARHRGRAQTQEDDIPVLTQETIAPEIPVLQDEIPLPVLELEERGPDSGLMFDPGELVKAPPSTTAAATPPLPPGGLMFDPDEFLRPPPAPELPTEEAQASASPDTAPNAAVAATAKADDALFMDLPLLDLDALTAGGDNPFAPAAEQDDAATPENPAAEDDDITLALDREAESHQQTAPAMQTDAWGIPVVLDSSEPVLTPDAAAEAPASPDPVAAPASEPAVVELVDVSSTIAASIPAFPDLPAETAVLDDQYWNISEPELATETTEPLAPAPAISDSGFPAMQVPAAHDAAAQLDPAYWALNTPPAASPTDDDWLAHATTPAVTVKEVDEPAALIWEDPESGDVLSIEPGPDEELGALLGETPLAALPAAAVAPQAAAEPPPPAKLTDSDVESISAMVGAHLAVEITAEVEQLTRQHFAKLMSSLYGDTLRQLTDAVCAELESKIGERIVALVQDELKDRGLLD